MIKKILGFGIFLFSLISFSSAVSIQKNASYVVSSMDSSIQFQSNNKGQLMSQRLGITKKMLAFISNDSQKIFFWRGPNKLPYVLIQRPNRGSTQGFAKHYYLCDELTGGSTSVMSNCSTYTISNDFGNEMGGFFQSITSNDYRGYDVYAWNCTVNTQQIVNKVCFSSSEYHKSICFSNGFGSVGAGCQCLNCGDLSGSLNLDIDRQFTAIPDSVIETPPGMTNNFDPGTGDSFSTGNTVIIPDTIDSYISYYENNFGFDEHMCYVGTNDLDSVYGTNGINFKKGRGATIYALYYHIYSGFGNNKIHNVGSFLNVRLMNYATWFDNVNPEDGYIAHYNGPDQDVTYIYSGITFPFANQPVAIYFMVDMLSNEYITESSQGENIIFYCDMKLNYDNYKNGSLDFQDTEDLVDIKIKERVKEYNFRNLPGRDGYSYPSSGTIWDGLIQSGYNIPKDLNPTDLFRDFYEKINGLFKDFNAVKTVGIIPWWILYPMLFLILFRIMKH